MYLKTSVKEMMNLVEAAQAIRKNKMRVALWEGQSKAEILYLMFFKRTQSKTRGLPKVSCKD